jgi:hypothetical protein
MEERKEGWKRGEARGHSLALCRDGLQICLWGGPRLSLSVKKLGLKAVQTNMLHDID